MFAIYLIVAAFIVAYSFYYAGQFERPEKGFSFFDDQADVVKCGLLVALFWPIIIVLVIVVGPFALFFYLGERKRKKINAAKTVDKNK